ncbi:MAG: GNAT family protein [Opitutaceae bacterium]
MPSASDAIPEILIREADPEDAAAILAYIDEVAGETDFLGFGRGEFDLDLEKETKYLEEQRDSNNSVYLLAMMDGEIAGTLSYTGGRRARTRHTGELGITVRRRYWGQGIGSLLMESLIAWARSSGVVTKLDLLVRTDNERAIQLYERMGFEREGRIRHAVHIDGVYHDALCMGLILDQ